MKIKPKIKVVLGVLIGIFLLLVSFFVVPMPNGIRRMLFLVAAVLGLAFFILGVVLIVMTVKKKVKGGLKWFLILARGVRSYMAGYVYLALVINSLLDFCRELFSF